MGLGLVRLHLWEPHQGEPSGPVANQLLAHLDLVCWLFNQSPAVVYAQGHGPGYVQLHLGFSSSGMALVDYATTLPQQDDYFSLSLIGSSGAAYADDHHDMQLVFSVGNTAALKTRPGDSPLLAQLQDFLSSMTNQRAAQPGPAELRRAIEVTEAITKSLATGQAVPLSTKN